MNESVEPGAEEQLGPIRFGIIGAGRVARDFAAGLASVDDAVVSAVWSRSKATAAAFVAAFPGTRTTLDDTDLVARDDVDVVYVATPHHLHAEHSLLALRNGKPVLCEKPFASDAAEAASVMAVARDRELFCMEAMWMRFIPAIERAKALVDSGAIGVPRMLFADFGVATYYDPASRFFDPDQGGGALLDRGVYAVSLAQFLFGHPVAVSGLSSPAPTGVDEHSGATIRFASGALAVVGASLTSTTDNAAIIVGTEGRIRIEAPFYCSARLLISRDAPPGPDVPGPDSRRAAVVGRAKQSRLGAEAVRVVKRVLRRPQVERLPLAGNGYGYEAQEVVRCLRAGLTESPSMSLDDSLNVLETLDQLRQHGA